MGDKKGLQHPLFRPLIGLKPLQGLTRVLKAGGVDEADDLLAIDTHWEGLTDHGFPRNGTDAHRVVFCQGGED